MADHCPEADDTLTVVEPSFFDYTAWAFDHRDQLKEKLRKADASEYLIRFIDTVERGTRHSVIMTLFRHHGSAHTSHKKAAEPNVKDLEEAYHLGGGFMTKLWDGEVADAFLQADKNNSRIMKEAFSKEEIITIGQEGRWSNDPEYIETLVEERW